MLMFRYQSIIPINLLTDLVALSREKKKKQLCAWLKGSVDFRRHEFQ